MKTVIVITQADNDRARESRDTTPDKYWDICQFCPVAQAFRRTWPYYTWFVNREGARPAGSHAYWYRLSDSLKQAIDSFDGMENKSIVGEFEIYPQSYIQNV